MKFRHTLTAAAILFTAMASAHATTFREFAHNIKDDAILVGKKAAQVGRDTGHAVVHAGKVVGHDVANGMHGDHASSNTANKTKS